MGLDFDVLEFCRKLKNSKQPPYECPLPQCGRVYKSLCGLQYHLVNFDHNAPTPQSPIVTPVRKKGRGSHTRTPTATADLLATPTREGLTYAEAQKMVEFEIEGRITRVSISEPLPIISKEEFEEAFGTNTDVCAIQGIDGKLGVIEEKIRLPEPCYSILDSYNISDAPPRPNAYIRFIERSAEEMDGEVEYDMDEEDSAWLTIINEKRAAAGISDVPVDTFELLMDRLEKESYFQMQSTSKTGDGSVPVVIDDDAVCCICMDGECQNSNVILFCDMCNLAVHQDCYGVPYIPEGQWLCRRCLQSPSRAVDCVLCPNNGGAFKQTDRGHWAHVVCALWIPEVRFANTVFLEPIDSIETIPPARWKLTCYICKQRGVGACIQCHKNNCYAAFHVTCAQQAGLFMKMDTVRDSNTGPLDTGPVLVQKTAYCDAHTPPDADSRPRQAISTQGSDGDDTNQKMKKARRLLAKKRSSVPIISIPTIPPERIQEIAELVNVPKKNQLIQRLIAYWTLKRQHRNGVPLLRRLQSSHLSRRDDARPLQEVGELYRQLKFWQCLRQDLERARLLCELVRKREKLKKELCKVKELCLRTELCPKECFMVSLIDLLQTKDTGEIFSEPVDQTEVLDYGEVVKQPMDLSTMRFKAENFEYSNLDALEADFNLMINNCMAYNSRDTVFYRAALKMREQGGALIKQAHIDMEACQFDPQTGLLLQPTSTDTRQPPDEAEIDHALSEISGKMEMGGREAIAQLIELQDRCHHMKLGPSRAKRLRLIRSALAKLRRRIATSTTPSEGEDGFESDSEHEDTTDEDDANGKKAAIQNVKVRTSSRRSTSHISGPESISTPVVISQSGATKETETSDETAENSVVRRGRRRKPGRRPKRECSSDSAGIGMSENAAPSNKATASGQSNMSQPPSVPDSLPSKESMLQTPPVTPVKMSPADHQSQLTVSPSGVNRRTAVLFTRKAAAAAFRKPETPGIGSNMNVTNNSTPNTSRRRVGRPRKNVTDTTNQPGDGQQASGSMLLGNSSESSLMPAPPLPTTESFRIYRSGGEIPAETDEDTQSDSSCWSCTTSEEEDGEEEEEEEGGGSSSGGSSLRGGAYSSAGEEEPGRTCGPSLEPLDLVWAKCRGYPWYPALIINPKMPRTGYLHNGVPIPAPPLDVLALASNYDEPVYLVLFFDTKRTWQWLPRNKLEPLGLTTEVDQAKLIESRKPADRKAVRKAYEDAMLHRRQVSSGLGPEEGAIILDEH